MKNQIKTNNILKITNDGQICLGSKRQKKLLKIDMADKI